LTTAELFIAVMELTPQVSFADEDGVSFWLPGNFGSLAAVPGQPGGSFATLNYYTNMSAGADVAAARLISAGRLDLTLRANLSSEMRRNHLDCQHRLDFVIGPDPMNRRECSVDVLLAWWMTGGAITGRID
jgi:hypothetical protein